MTRIVHIALDDSGLPTADARDRSGTQGRAVRSDGGKFLRPAGRATTARPPEGPYKLHLSIRDKRLVFAVFTETDDPGRRIPPEPRAVPPGGERITSRSAKSYFSAVKTAAPSQIENHRHGPARQSTTKAARVLQERLDGKAVVDTDTCAAPVHPDLCVALGGLGRMAEALPQSVLFCCDHNAVRSPMAEG